MMLRDNCGEPVPMADLEHPAVMIELRDGKLTGRRFHAGPLDGKTVGIEAQARNHRVVFGVAMVVITGVARGFHKQAALDVFEQPEIGIGVAAFDLMRCRRYAAAKSLWKFHRDHAPPIRSGFCRMKLCMNAWRAEDVIVTSIVAEPFGGTPPRASLTANLTTKGANPRRQYTLCPRG